MLKKERVIIAGYGLLGSAMAKNLHEHKSLVVVADREEAAIKRAQADGFNTLLCDMSTDEGLKQAGVGDTAAALYCVTSDSEVNLYITISARSIDPTLKILSRAKDANDRRKLLLAGATQAVDLNEICSSEIFHMLRRPKALEIVSGLIFKKNRFFKQSGLMIEEIVVKQNSFLDRKHFAQIDAKEYDILILGIQDKYVSEKFLFNLSGKNHQINSGDVLVVIGNMLNICRFAALAEADEK